MKKEFKIYRGSTTITYLETDEIKQQVLDKIIEWCKEYNAHSGEMLCQSDDCQIYAPILIADIIDDILQFESNDEE